MAKREPYTPDSIELNDWVAINQSELYAATKYMSDAHAQYTLWLKVWKDKGSPPI